MKKLLSLLLITLITAVSWASCAKNNVTNMTTFYNLSNAVTPSSLFMTSLTTPETDESLSFPQVKIVSEHNRFFEQSIIFNENLQQVISFFTRSDNKKSTIVDNSFPSYNDNSPTVKACKENS